MSIFLTYEDFIEENLETVNAMIAKKRWNKLKPDKRLEILSMITKDPESAKEYTNKKFKELPKEYHRKLIVLLKVYK